MLEVGASLGMVKAGGEGEGEGEGMCSLEKQEVLLAALLDYFEVFKFILISLNFYFIYSSLFSPFSQSHLRSLISSQMFILIMIVLFILLMFLKCYVGCCVNVLLLMVSVLLGLCVVVVGGVG